MANKLPLVAVVGRANVGKSSIFNRLVGSRQAIVADEPGTTRDSVQARIEHNGAAFWLVDTAGMKTPEDDFELTIQEQITQATESADLIIVVVEADKPISEEDRKAAKIALKSKRPVLLAVNKIDKAKKLDTDAFKGLGIKFRFETSAEHNRGIKELSQGIVKHIPKRLVKPSTAGLHIAIIGRPNAGKSYLFNALAKKQQAIVAKAAGTTRDINRVKVSYRKTPIELMDTAGIRRSGKIERGVEKFSILRTIWAIQQADICLLVMDVNEPNTHLDQRIAGMVKDAGKGLIIVISKWDDIEKDQFTRDQLAKQIQLNFQHVHWAPLIFTSAVTGQNVTKLFDLALEIQAIRTVKLKTAELNTWLQNKVAHHPPAGLKNRHPKLRYVTQTDSTPPTLTIFGTSTDYLHWSYKRYLEHELRRDYNFSGTPIVMEFSNKRRH